LAQASLALAKSLDLTDTEQAAIADEFEHMALLMSELDTQ
jgi:hypothetical protein